MRNLLFLFIMLTTLSVTTLRNKCLKAMELYQGDLAAASEGSFGPHPSVFFMPSDDELIFLYDAKNQMEILERELTTATNFDSREIKNRDELWEFSSKARFPTHGLVVRKSRDEYEEITKGITDWNILQKAVDHLVNRYGSAFLETDMRAMYNPTRMAAIEKATQKLVERIHSRCPACNAPGFGITSLLRGLPCRECTLPTRSILAY